MLFTFTFTFVYPYVVCVVYVGFWEEGETGTPGENLGARDRTNNNPLNPHMATWLSTPGFELGPH